MKPRIRLRLFGSCLAVVLLLLLGPGLEPDCRGESLKAGTEVFAVDPAMVLELTLSSPDWRLIAHRWDTRQPFTIIFQAKGQRLPNVCQAGNTFRRILEQLTSLKLSRTPEAGQTRAFLETKPLPSWWRLEIRDTSQLAPFAARLLPVPGSSTESLVHFNDATYIIALRADIFALIAKGCPALGQ